MRTICWMGKNIPSPRSIILCWVENYCIGFCDFLIPVWIEGLLSRIKFRINHATSWNSKWIAMKIFHQTLIVIFQALLAYSNLLRSSESVACPPVSSWSDFYIKFLTLQFISAKKLGEQCYYKESCKYADQYSSCMQVHHNAICQCNHGYHTVAIQKPSKRVFCAEGKWLHNYSCHPQNRTNRI